MKRVFDYQISSIFHTSSDLKKGFKDEFEKVNGEFFEFSEEKFIDFLRKENIKSIAVQDDKFLKLIPKNIQIITNNEEFHKAVAGISDCDYLIANTGTIAVSSNNNNPLKINFLPPIMLFICSEKKLIDDIKTAIKKMKNNLAKKSVFITGPSRTADIEKTLILGMHGPKRVIVFLTA